MRCINCDLDLRHSRRILVLELDNDIRTMIAKWITPVIVTETDFICEQCWEAAVKAMNESLVKREIIDDTFEASSSVPQPQRVVGHSKVCLSCGRSVLRIPSELGQSLGSLVPQLLQSSWM